MNAAYVTLQVTSPDKFGFIRIHMRLQSGFDPIVVLLLQVMNLKPWH
jgi:hypothetical protein